MSILPIKINENYAIIEIDKIAKRGYKTVKKSVKKF